MLEEVLCKVVEELSSYGLSTSAKWSAELLCCCGTSQQQYKEHPLDVEYITKNKSEEWSNKKVVLGRTYLDSREYSRAAFVLRDCTGSRATFIHNYALYLAGEKRKDEDLLDTAPAAEKSVVVNKELKMLRERLQTLYDDKSHVMDGFNLYLYAVVLKELDLKDNARKLFIESVNRYPWNWSAWLDLASLCTEQQTATQVVRNIVDHWMKDFFLAHLALELHQNEESLKIYDKLSVMFPGSTYILSQTAMANYNLREQLFETLLEKDPFRVENLDTYSNILYVKENRAKLSLLAHKTSETDKYRPETCCVIGNYYSIKSEHEKAVLYFKRALKLNRKFLSAWTLMGHEYVEMKNTRAAIEAYRKAVDTNPRDFRAWYGLGQTYELMKMHLYALFYYNKATTLKPYDSRMWCAMAGCYEALDRKAEAIKCYERAESNKDRENIALSKLASLYYSINDETKAAFYYKKNLDLRDQEGSEGQETVDALLFLANYCKNMGNYHEAEKYCSRLLDYAGKEKEEAKSLLREIHQMMK